MRALEQLPEHEKDLILPTIFIRPWVSSKELSKSIDRIQKAFGDRPFFIDIDRYYTAGNIDRPAVRDFLSLRDPVNYVDWFNFIQEIPNAIPSLRLDGIAAEELNHQIELGQQMDRPFLFRIDRSAGHSVRDIIAAAQNIEHSNYLFSVDAGWDNDLLNHQLWSSQVVGQIGLLRPEISVIITGSSFPAEFGHVEPYGSFNIRERLLYNEVLRNNNTVNCLYGDWASVRPPSNQQIPMTPVPRLDLALEDKWAFFRYRNNDGGYMRAAEECLESDYWDNDLNIWGTYLIKATAEGDANEITYPGIATAARINMHLHSQINFGDPQGYIDTEDDFID